MMTTAAVTKETLLICLMGCFRRSNGCHNQQVFDVGARVGGCLSENYWKVTDAAAPLTQMEI